MTNHVRQASIQRAACRTGNRKARRILSRSVWPIRCHREVYKQWRRRARRGSARVETSGAGSSQQLPQRTWQEKASSTGRCGTIGPKNMREKLEAHLDQGIGECWLRRPGSVAQLVENALRHFDGERYLLGSYVIMPNHVHVLVHPAWNTNLPDILHSWKSFTANEANKILGRSGPNSGRTNPSITSFSERTPIRAISTATSMKIRSRPELGDGTNSSWASVLVEKNHPH